jgi:hypothetical protein
MRFFKKRNRAVKKWHSRAMVIDVSKTRVTFIRSDELSDPEELGGDSPQLDEEVVSQPRDADKTEYQPWF